MKLRLLQVHLGFVNLCMTRTACEDKSRRTYPLYVALFRSQCWEGLVAIETLDEVSAFISSGLPELPRLIWIVHLERLGGLAPRSGK